MTTLNSYGNLSDFLYDHAATIKDVYRARYKSARPEIDLLTAVMDAVRVLPGLDRPPKAENTFVADIEAALAGYHRARGVPAPVGATFTPVTNTSAAAAMRTAVAKLRNARAR